ncbi:fimbria/pilus periplasmic chaperone [Salmonella enterica]|nr:fimbria/pilus periplasmic chaperone [Salmonella enterica]
MYKGDFLSVFKSGYYVVYSFSLDCNLVFGRVRLSDFFISCDAQAVNTELNVKSYGLSVNHSRVIFPGDALSIGIKVSNPRNYPVLVHSRVLAEDKKRKGGA